MTRRILFFCILIGSLGNCVNRNIRVQTPENISKYKQALSFIVNEKEASKNFRVSQELINFKTLSFYFKETLEEHNFKREDFLFDSKIITSNQPALKELSTNENSENHLFFSEEHNGMFYLEIFLKTKKNHMKYSERPHFGKSCAYLFLIKGDNVELLEKKELIYG